MNEWFKKDAKDDNDEVVLSLMLSLASTHVQYANPVLTT